MAAPKVRIDYESMKQIAQAFARESEAAGHTLQSLQRAMDVLQGGDWVGKGAKAFYREMEQDVLPAMRRLNQALGSAKRVTLQIVQLMQGAEDEASAILRAILAGLISAGGFLGAVGSALGSALGHIGDFFVGMWEEGKDMVMGLYNLVTDPIGTAKGLWHGITHPGELWEAFKQPYVEAWESGHPGQAIGRGVMFIGSILLGTKGADKAAKAAKAARAARVTTEAAEAGSRLGSALAAADDIGRVAQGSRAETALARFVAQESTRAFGNVDRVVLGGFNPNPARGFLGYVDEAKAFGGRVYNTADNVGDALYGATGNGRGWAVNREFMQAQLERGVARFDLRGETVSEILNDPLLAGKGRALEIDYLQRYAYEYGYRQVGDSWVKVGDWRASTTGRAVGGSAGPSLDVLEDVSQ